MKNVDHLSAHTAEVFKEAFGRSSIKTRVNDILGEAIELSRFTDIKNFREELGDIIASCFVAAEELGVSVEVLLQENWEKIKNRRVQYKSMGRKINVALMGGAFDPIHLGHIQVAKTVLKAAKEFDEVWLCPCYKSVYGKKMENAEHRLRMCELAIDDPRIKVFDYEIANKFGGTTLHFMNTLNEDPLYKDTYRFAFIMGMDNANHAEDWFQWEELEKRVRFVVAPRKGETVDVSRNPWYLSAPHVFLAGENIMELSSTEIRAGFKGGFHQGFFDERLYPAVTEYIFDNKLYGCSDLLDDMD